MKTHKNAHALKTLLKAAAFALTLAPATLTHGAASIDFSGDATTAENANVKSILSSYANGTASYDALLAAIAAAKDADALPSTTFWGTDFAGAYQIANNKAGAVHLTEGATLSFTPLSVTSLNFLPDSLGVFTAESGASYLFAGNTASNGGAIALGNQSRLTLTNASFLENSAIEGGAIYNPYGTVTLIEATFSGNSANSNGGAIYNYVGTVTLTNATFTENSANFDGGAIYNRDGTVTLTDVSFTGNSIADNGGAIANVGGIVTLNVSAGKTSTFSGNIDSSGANSIYLNYDATLNVFTEDAAVLDMRDPIRTEIYGNSTTKKTGTGTWKLGGTNVLDEYSATTFDVTEGTLYLYREGEVGNAYTGTDSGLLGAYGDAVVGAGVIQNSNGSFTLGSGATLAPGGGNAISAQTITLQSGATLAFDLANASVGTPILTLTGTVSIGDDIHINLLSLNSNAGSYTLVSGGDFTGKLVPITLHNEAISGTRAEPIYTVTGDTTGISYVSPGAFASAVVTWSGDDSNDWNITANNWNGTNTASSIVTQFLHGDVVNFYNLSGGTETIALNAAGDGTVHTAGIFFIGDDSYTFLGASLNASTDGTALTGDAAQGKLVLGAGANRTSVADTEVVSSEFTGTVDLTGTGANHFTGGVELYSGTLRIGAVEQLGTTLNQLAFPGVTPAAQLRIAEGQTVTFGGQQLNVGTNKYASIFTEDGATFAIEGSNGTWGGAVEVGENAHFNFSGSGDFLFQNNFTAFHGGAIYSGNGAELSLTNTTFTGNTSTYNGGAIYNNNGTLSLTNATFTGNTAVSYGGAIYNSGGTVVLNVSEGKTSAFSGNIGGLVANSVFFFGGNLNVFTDADAVLDMLDPMSVEGPGSITKTGTGTWKLGGTSTLKYGVATFDVNTGTLYLYREGEVRNAYTGTDFDLLEQYGEAVVGAGVIQNTLGTFTLGSAATLALGGGNEISADTITLESGATLVFDLANASEGTPILTLDVVGVSAGTLNINLLSLNQNAGSFTLVSSNTGDFSGVLSGVLSLKGVNTAGTRVADLFTFTSTENEIVLTQNAFTSAVVRWVGGDAGDWNIADANWDGSNTASSTVTQFLHGDVVNFFDIESGSYAITLNAEGDGTVHTAGIFFSGGKNYTFTGESLNASTDGTVLTGDAALGKLVLGAGANRTSSTDTDVAPDSFTGTVDLTGTGTNHFSGGVELRSGTLRIGTVEQLGTTLNQLVFIGDASDGDTPAPQLRIAAGSELVFHGERLEIDNNKSGSIYVESGASFIIEESSDYYEGGAVSVGSGAKFTFSGEGDFIFRNNSGGDGGAIKNEGTLILTDASFFQNSAQFGGAIYNYDGTVTLNVSAGKTSTFSGNWNNRSGANSVYLLGGTLNIVTDGTDAVLDMRDPILTENISSHITKSGEGTWKLAGDNYAFYVSTTFAVEAGTLYLYREDDNGTGVGAGHIRNGDNGTFTLGGAATLAPGGGNVIDAQTITLTSGATLAFNLENASAGDTALTLTGGSGGISVGSAIQIYVPALNTNAGVYTLVSGGDFAGKLVQADGGLALQSVSPLRDGPSYGIVGTENGITYSYVEAGANTTVTWGGGASSDWNTSDAHWGLFSAEPVSPFINGDAALFESNAGGTFAITINSGNDGIVHTAGISFGGEGDYTFTGTSLIASFDGTTHQGEDANAKLLFSRSFTGAVDLTGTGANDFAGGVELRGGTLRIGTVSQLGTTLGKLVFSGSGTDNVPTLRIAEDSELIFSGQRLKVDSDNSGSIFSEAGATFVIENNIGDDSFGGAVHAGGGVFDFSGAGNFIFRNNVSGMGGAIVNDIEFTLSNAVLSGNSALYYGGAIFSGGNATLTNVSFFGNSAVQFGGAIVDDEYGTLTLKVTTGKTATFSGNYDSTGANSVFLLMAALNIVTDGTDAVLDMRDPIRAAATGNSVTKTGTGTWKLGGTSALDADDFDISVGAATDFTVTAGTLYLYRAGEVGNAYTGTDTDLLDQYGEAVVGAGVITNTNGTFTLGSAATLALGGGNAISADTITLESGATLAFDLAHASTNDAALTLTGGNGGIDVGDEIKIFIPALNTTPGVYTLVSGGDFAGKLVQASGGLALQNTAATRAESSYDIVGTSSGIIYTYFAVANGVVAWNGTNSGDWNITDANWLGNDSNASSVTQFLHGDAVNFAAADASVHTLTLNTDDDGTVQAAGIFFSGVDSYTFLGDSLNASTDGTDLTGDAAQGKLVLGALASRTGGTATAVTPTSFTGTVDLTGTGANDFASGVELRGGTLRIGAVGQLGTTLGNLAFLGNGSGTTPQLRIAEGQTVTFSASGDASQQLEIGKNNSGNIYVEDGATFIIEGGDGGKVAGAVAVAIGGNLDLGGSGHFIFRNNSAATGGAIYNDNEATLFIRNVTFSENFSTSNTRNGGGAIFNDPDATLTLTDATFTENASAYEGGAIYNNSGTVTLTDASFAGNSAGNRGGAIFNATGTVTLNVSEGKTSTFSGNVDGLGANSVYLSGGDLNVFTDTGAVLDMLDPIRATAESSITKTGAGTWKLGGTNVLDDEGATTNFAVNAGTLYFYRAGEVANANRDNAGAVVGAGVIQNTNGTFTLGGAATLALGGGNAISADTITLESGATLAFDLAHASTSGAALTLTGGINVGGEIKIFIPALNTTPGVYTLVSGGDFAGKLVQASGGLALQNTAATRAESSYDIVGTSSGITYTYFAVANGVVKWSGTDSGDWNITGANWLGTDSNASSVTQFLHGDAVNFAAADASVHTLTLNTDDDGTVQAAGIFFSGVDSYTFLGDSLIASTDGTLLTGEAAQGKLVLGALASRTGGTATAVTPASYTGTVDLTDTGANDFTGGVELYSGTLRIGAVDQLGTTLSNLAFLGSGSGPMPQLRIAEGQTVTFNGNGDGNQRLEIGYYTSGSIYAEDGATFIIEGSSDSYAGGAVYVDSDATFEFSGAGNFIFRDNFSDFNGGAIMSYGTTTLANADFINNTAEIGGAIRNGEGVLTLVNSNFSGNSATRYGGAIHNERSTVILTNVSFFGNSANEGGAITGNEGTLVLNVTEGVTATFSGNTDRTGANSIYMGEANLNITTDGAGATLDMRDPFRVVGSENSVTKTGAGTWKLGGTNDSSDSTIFTVTEGTLYLYREGEVANANRDNAGAVVGAGIIQNPAGTFTLGAGATLAPGGSNAISAETITLESGATLAFDLANASTSEAALLLTGGVNVGGVIQISIPALNTISGVYTLVSGGDFTGKLVQAADGIALQNTATTRAEVSYAIVGTGSGITYTYWAVANGAVTWTGANANWNGTAPNWDGTDTNGRTISQFLNGDTVRFDDTGVTRAVVVDGGGVIAESVTIVTNDTGADAYTFSGGTVQTGTLTKTGSGEVTFDGAFVTDALVVSGGVFTSLSSESEVTESVVVTGGATLALDTDIIGADATRLLDNGTLALSGEFELFGDWTIGSGGGIFDVATNGKIDFKGSLLGSGDFVKAGDGALFYDAAAFGNFGGTLTINGGTWRQNGETFDSPLTGDATFEVTLENPGDTFSFGPNVGNAFTGEVVLTQGTIDLGNPNNPVVLENAGLTLTGDSTVTVPAAGVVEIESLTLGGGTVELGNLGGDASPTLALSDVLDVSAGGTIDFTLPVGGENIFTFSEEQGRQLISSESAVDVAGGATLTFTDDGVRVLGGGTGEARFEYTPRVETSGDDAGLWVDYALVEITANVDKTVVLDATGADDAVLNVPLTGEGGFLFTGGAGQPVELGNAASTYAGDSEVSNIALTVTTDNAFGAVAGLTLTDGASVDSSGFAQEFTVLNTEAGTSLTVPTLTVESGEVAGAVTVTDTLAKTGTADLTFSGELTVATLEVQDGVVAVTNAASEITGAVSVTNGGTLVLGADVIAEEATRFLDNGTLSVVGEISLGGDWVIGAAGGTFATNDAADKIDFTGKLVGGGTVTKTGEGVVVTDTSTFIGYTGTLEISEGTWAYHGETFNTPLSGEGTFAVTTGDKATAFVFGGDVGTGFTGGVLISTGTIALDAAENVAVLVGADLALTPDSIATVTGSTGTTIKSLALGGGELVFDNAGEEHAPLLTLTDALDITAGGVIRLNFLPINTTAPTTGENLFSLWDTDGNYQRQLIASDSVIGSGVVRVEPISSSSEQVRPFTDASGAAKFDYTTRVTPSGDGAGLWLGYGLVEIAAYEGKTVVLDASSAAEAKLNVSLVGAGGFHFTGGAGQAVELGNATSTYAGDTEVSKIALTVTAENAFGGVAGLTLTNGASVDSTNFAQAVTTLNLAGHTALTAPALTVADGGVVDGTVMVTGTAQNSGVVTGAGTWSAASLANSGDFTAANVIGAVANTGTFTVTGLLTGSISNGPGALATLRDVNGAVSNRGGVIHLSSDVTRWGALDNTRGLVDFVNAGRELRVASLHADPGEVGHMRLDINLLDVTQSDRLIVDGAITGRHEFDLELADNFDVNQVTAQSGNFVYVAVGAHYDEDVVGVLHNVGLYDFVLTWDDAQGGYVFRAQTNYYNTLAQAALNSAGATSTAWFGQLDSLSKRFGDLRLAAPATNGDATAPAAALSDAFWLRTNAQRVNVDLGIAGVGSFREWQSGADVGYDHAFAVSADSQLYLGGFAAFQNANRNFAGGVGKGNSDSAAFGAYATWLREDGWYADGVVKGQYFDSDYDASGAHGEFKNYGLGASFEIGRQFNFENGAFVEPGVQFSYAHIFAESYTATTGLRVAASDSDILRAAFSVRAGWKLDLGVHGRLSPYVSAGVEQQESLGGSVRAGQERWEPNVDGTRANVGLGVAWQLDATQQIHFDYEASFGNKYEKPWGVNLGYRKRF